ncbi:MAG: PTS sugar transporter subunit IIC [Erysipelotrichia bacterium]|nr:PTS sugar transporter subunit IIC [Erysipelotrichia bacterium]
MPDGVPSALANSFEALVPVIIMASASAILSVLILNISGTTLPALVLMAISPIVKFIDNVFGVSFIALLQNVLWWFGIHDTAIGSVISPIRDANIAMNAAAYAGGTAATNLPYVFTSPFWWVFCQIGGTGSTFGLCILLLCSRSKQLKEVGKLAIVPAFFNINEPILFGIPIVLNPLWFAPFVFTQIFNAASTYLVMQMNLINRTFIEPGWNLFAPFGAYFSTLDFRAVIFILILMVVDTLIYLPFFKVQEKICIKEELEMKTETVQSEME